MNQPPQNPAGPYSPEPNFSESRKLKLIESLEMVPNRALESVAGLSEDHLDTKYRNWTVRQIIHHLADSHVNCYVRFKWALTEETPRIKSYDESLWAETAEAKSAPLNCSMEILRGIHSRWCHLLRQMDAGQMARRFFHPELDCEVTLAEALPNYVWHSNHHLAQIDWLRREHNW